MPARDLPYNMIKIGLYHSDRAALYERINQRVDQMFEEGLLEEMQALLAAGYTAEDQGMRAIGYRELFPFLEGWQDLATAIELIKRNSRRYAKRQLTYFRRYRDIQWFATDQVSTEQILDQLRKF